MSNKNSGSVAHAVKSVSAAAESALTELGNALPDGEELEKLRSRAADQLAAAGERGVAEAKRGLGAATSLARKHPGAAAGALLGVGVLVGAIAHRAFHREPTLGELLMRSLENQLKRFTRTAQLAASAGLLRITEPLNKALR